METTFRGSQKGAERNDISWDFQISTSPHRSLLTRPGRENPAQKSETPRIRTEAEHKDQLAFSLRIILEAHLLRRVG